MNVAGKQVLAGLAVNAAGKHGVPDFLWLRLGSMVLAGLAVDAAGKHGACRTGCEYGWEAGLAVNPAAKHGV